MLLFFPLIVMFTFMLMLFIKYCTGQNVYLFDVFSMRYYLRIVFSHECYFLCHEELCLQWKTIV